MFAVEESRIVTRTNAQRKVTVMVQFEAKYVAICASPQRDGGHESCTESCSRLNPLCYQYVLCGCGRAAQLPFHFSQIDPLTKLCTLEYFCIDNSGQARIILTDE